MAQSGGPKADRPFGEKAATEEAWELVGKFPANWITDVRRKERLYRGEVLGSVPKLYWGRRRR
jgi:hypothetical protein